MTARIQLVDADHPNPRHLHQAVEILLAGGLVVYPTDAAYGIGCDLSSRKAIERLYALKAKDPKAPATFLCADLSMAARYAQVPDVAYRTLKRLTPGPYTFILKASREVPKVVTTRQKTVGVRIPDAPVVLGLIERLGRPLLNTTATDAGGETLGDPREIRDRFGDGVDLILDVGLNLLDTSTVVDLTGEEPEVLRVGKGPVDAL